MEQQKTDYSEVEQKIQSIRTMNNDQDLDYEGLFEWLTIAEEYHQNIQDYPTELICRFLYEFVKVFKKMGKALGMAFEDVNEKVATLRERTQQFKIPLFFKLVEHEQSLNIHKLNGDNNKKLGAAPEYKKYNSAARQMLRMIRFMDYLYVMFNLIVKEKQKSISDCTSQAYKETLMQHHAFMVKTAAKAAMSMAPKREKFLYLVVEKDKTQEFSYEVMEKMVFHINKIKTGLWDYYNKNGLSDLP